MTLPKTTCFPSSHEVFFVVGMKNCEPFVFGPAFAIASAPRTILCSLNSSSNGDRPAGSGALWAAALDHEVGDHPVEGQPVVENLLAQRAWKLFDHLGQAHVLVERIDRVIADHSPRVPVPPTSLLRSRGTANCGLSAGLRRRPVLRPLDREGVAAVRVGRDRVGVRRGGDPDVGRHRLNRIDVVRVDALIRAAVVLSRRTRQRSAPRPRPTWPSRLPSPRRPSPPRPRRRWGGLRGGGRGVLSLTSSPHPARARAAKTARAAIRRIIAGILCRQVTTCPSRRETGRPRARCRNKSPRRRGFDLKEVAGVGRRDRQRVEVAPAVDEGVLGQSGTAWRNAVTFIPLNEPPGAEHYAAAPNWAARSRG